MRVGETHRPRGAGGRIAPVECGRGVRASPLDDRRRALLVEERSRLAEAAALLARADAPRQEQDALARSIEQLDAPFLLVVVGEFNGGKSALINALLGARVLEEGVTPTTSRVTVLAHGPVVAREVLGAGLERAAAPSGLLRDVSLVDTPGTNAVLREHEALSRDFVPRSDLVLFVTSADRPFAESERAFLSTIREWGKEVVVVVNKADILEGEGDLARVTGFVREKATQLLGFAPAVVPVSAKRALRGKLEGDAALCEASGLPRLERHLSATLGDAGRFRLKLLNPLGVGERLLREAGERAAARLELLREDVAALEQIESQLALFREDLRRDFRFRLSDVEKEVLEFERRGHAFFGETLRLGRVFDLLNRERVRDEFERSVVADLPRQVEGRVTGVVDWMVESEQALWRGLAERLARRQAAHRDRMLGYVGGFEHDRARLLAEVRREAQRAVEGYDHQAEARRLAGSVRDVVAGGALLQVGALGLGAVVTAIATTAVADVTGLLAAGTLSVVGLLLLPARRRRARLELRQRVTAMREKLLARLSDAFEREIARGLERFDEALGPYTRFVRAERERLTALRDELDRLLGAFDGLRARVEAVGAPRPSET
jgi:GTP-binding protein EngB required for normal cell division